MAAYYNENDKFVAEWLRNLIREGLIADGDVDERDIRDVRPDDVRGYTQCHWFAGIGGWSIALCIAGWPDDRPVWTGSCPCQPFSAAGKGAGFADERHLWPDYYWLIDQCRPATLFGEQVASKNGLAWFDLVQADLEASSYAVAAADLCAAGVGAPHIRQRLWFVAQSEHGGCQGRNAQWAWSGSALPPSKTDELADADGGQRGWRADGEGRERDGTPAGRQQGNGVAQSGGYAGELADTGHEYEGRPARPAEAPCGRAFGDATGRHAWSNCDWLPCRDGKARPVEPGTFPLAHGIPGRVGRLRAYGNAIIPQVAAEFIAATYPASRR
jgi:DNA (cytosine-5)-methyltransferase 1